MGELSLSGCRIFGWAIPNQSNRYSLRPVAPSALAVSSAAPLLDTRRRDGCDGGVRGDRPPLNVWQARAVPRFFVEPAVLSLARPTVRSSTPRATAHAAKPGDAGMPPNALAGIVDTPWRRPARRATGGPLSRASRRHAWPAVCSNPRRRCNRRPTAAALWPTGRSAVRARPHQSQRPRQPRSIRVSTCSPPTPRSRTPNVSQRRMVPPFSWRIRESAPSRSSSGGRRSALDARARRLPLSGESARP